MSHRFEEVSSDDETPTTRPTHTYDDDNEIPINRGDARNRPNRNDRNDRNDRTDRTDRTNRNFRGGDERFGRNERNNRGRGGFHDDFFGNSGFGLGFGSMFRDPFFSDPFGNDDFFGGGLQGRIGSMMREFDNMHNHMNSHMNSLMNSSMEQSRGSGNGKFYTKTQTFVSQNGVTQQTVQESDSTGKKRVKVQRQIGDKGSEVETILDSSGNEVTTKRLNNMLEDEENDFEENWSKNTGVRFQSDRLLQLNNGSRRPNDNRRNISIGFDSKQK